MNKSQTLKIKKRILDKVRRTIQDFGMFQKNDAVLLGVSGGPDSIALLRILTALAADFSLRIGVAHLNHGLRREASDDEAAFVAAAARDQGLPCHIEKRNVIAYKSERKLSLETAARDIRYAFFDEIARIHHYGKIALGHQADDNAELILMFLMRGSGTAGFSGIPPVRGKRIVRPLIRLSRREILDYLEAVDASYVSDHTNADVRFLRNRIRHQLLPLIRQDYNPRIEKSLNRFAEISRDENRWLEAFLAPFYQNVVSPVSQRELRLSVSKMQSYDVALKRRLIRKALAAVKGNLHRISFHHVEATVKLIDGEAKTGRLDLPDRILLKRRGDWLQVTRQERPLRQIEDESGVAKNFTYHYDVPFPELATVAVDIRESNLRIRFSRIRAEDRPNLTGQRVAFFDMDKLSFPLHLRNIRPGDRFIPLGMRGHQKLKKYFIDHKVPSAQRRACPILVSQGQIIWLVGHRIDERFKVAPSTRWVLECGLSCLTAQDD